MHLKVIGCGILYQGLYCNFLFIKACWTWYSIPKDYFLTTALLAGYLLMHLEVMSNKI